MPKTSDGKDSVLLYYGKLVAKTSKCGPRDLSKCCKKLTGELKAEVKSYSRSPVKC